jgi:dCTP deaminase
MILSAQSIRQRCKWAVMPMLIPFHERSLSNGRSFGLSPCGYDIRIAEDIWLWPFWGRLASSIEHFRMPSDVCAEVKDKSTNARLFVFVQNTIIEPGWHGYLTLKLTRFKPWPIRIKRGTPIAQVVFKQLDRPTVQPYAGKYQGQDRGGQKARMENADAPAEPLVVKLADHAEYLDIEERVVLAGLTLGIIKTLGKFPRREPISEARVGWLEREIVEHVM